MKASQGSTILLAAVIVASAVLGGFWWKQRSEDDRDAAKARAAAEAIEASREAEQSLQEMLDTRAIDSAIRTLKRSHGYSEERITALLDGANFPAAKRLRLEGEIELRERVIRGFGDGLSPEQQRVQADEIIARIKAEVMAETEAESITQTP